MRRRGTRKIFCSVHSNFSTHPTYRVIVRTLEQWSSIVLVVQSHALAPGARGWGSTGQLPHMYTHKR